MKATYYIRDAQGNIMATYERKQILDYTLGDPAFDLFSGFSVLDDKLSLSEWPIYGSARLGVLDLNGKGELYNNGTAMWTKPLSHTKAGYREYEITNHLGNVLATISDVKQGIDDPVDGTIDYYNPLPLSQQDYYPFGMIMPGRNDVKYEYRFGFNGHEKDDEVKGEGNHLSFGDYGYDPRTGRRWNVDPMSKKYPDESPYIFSGNSPISITDQDGKEKTYYLTRIAKDGTTTQLKVVEKYTVQQQTTYTRESIGVGGVTLFTSPQISNTKTFDVAQHITLDERTGKVTVGKEYTTTERSNSAIVRGIEDNARELGNNIRELGKSLDQATNGGGGIVFISEIGQGQETRKGYNADAQSENIDLLTSVLGAASAASTSSKADGFLDLIKQGVDAITIDRDVNDHYESLNQGTRGTGVDSCTLCGTKGPKGTIDHGYPVVPAKRK